MRKVVAFLTALVLFLSTAVGLHFLASGHLGYDNPKFDAWVNDDKLLYGKVISNSLTADTIPVFGSSEFRHGRGTPYHPAKLLAGQPFRLMLIGAGYYQSLYHATALAAIAPAMQQKKAVLFVSPQWFRPSGVLPEVYSSRFSEYNFSQMLQNPQLSEETKQYIIDRTNELLKPDPKALERTHLYERMQAGQASLWDKIHYHAWKVFYNEKMSMGVVLKAMSAGITRRGRPQEPRPEPDWQAEARRADEDGAKANTTNPYGMDDSFYYLYKNTMLKSKKDSMKDADYTQSPEYDDLICFLKVCKEMGIKPLLVSVPVNGPWYDFMGFPKENRDAYYQKIRDIAAEYGAELADFSGDEYTPHFFEDNTHIARKGWVSVNESLYRFATEA